MAEVDEILQRQLHSPAYAVHLVIALYNLIRAGEWAERPVCPSNRTETN